MESHCSWLGTPGTCLHVSLGPPSLPDVQASGQDPVCHYPFRFRYMGVCLLFPAQCHPPEFYLLCFILLRPPGPAWASYHCHNAPGSYLTHLNKCLFSFCPLHMLFQHTGLMYQNLSPTSIYSAHHHVTLSMNPKSHRNRVHQLYT